MKIDKTAVNPYYPNSIRLCEVFPGVSFRIYNIRTGLIDSGTFNSEPFLSDGLYRVKATLSKSNNMEYLELSKYGVAERDENDHSTTWQTGFFMIENTSEEITKFVEWLDEKGRDKLYQRTMDIYYCRSCYDEELSPRDEEGLCDDCDYDDFICGKVKFKI